MGLTRFIYVRSRLVFRFLLFIIDKMGDLSLQEPESREIIRSDTNRFPPMPVQVDLAYEV
jgi:hypothetical protein